MIFFLLKTVYPRPNKVKAKTTIKLIENGEMIVNEIKIEMKLNTKTTLA